MVDDNKYVTYGRGGKLDNNRVRSTHLDDFYRLQRWIKRLEGARNSSPDEFYREVDRIIHEMKNRTNDYSALDSRERENLTNLAQFPESLLSKYYS